MSAACNPNPSRRNLVGVSPAKIRQIFLETVTEEDVKNMTRKLIEMAKEGDFRALKLLMTYVLGKPGPGPSAEELQQAALSNGLVEEALAETKSEKWDEGLPPITAADLLAAGSSGYGDASDIRVANRVGKRQDKRRK